MHMGKATIVPSEKVGNSSETRRPLNGISAGEPTQYASVESRTMSSAFGAA
jgi:hypothetical protein